ncbi:MAG: hypothetical protein STHCBS139747_006113 [Sporothrix thermara]
MFSLQKLFRAAALAVPLIAVQVSAVACKPTKTAPQAAVATLVDFGFPSWAENLAVRSNGQILVSRLDSPAVYQVDPVSSTASLVYAWNASEYMGCLGISETVEDVFFVIASAMVDDDFVKTSGVNSIYKIDMTNAKTPSEAIVTHLVDITPADFLNGMTTLDSTHILVSDVYSGVIYVVDTVTGAYSVAIDDPKMKFSYVADPPTNLGSNGIKIFNGHLYWTNTAAGFLARIPIDSTGRATGASSIAATNVPKADDFIIRSDGVAFICQNQMDTLSIAYLSSGSVVAQPIAGSNTSTLMAGVSAAKFGRTKSDSTRLYLTTTGGLALPINGTVLVDGTVSYISTTQY